MTSRTRRWAWPLYLALWLIVLFVESNAGLSLQGVKCGIKTCTLQQYCSTYSTQCEPCSNICEEAGHNFDRDLCKQDCQAYIHDKRYILRNEGSSSSSGDDQDLKAVVKRLQDQQRVTLILTSVILLVLALVFIIKFVRWGKDHKVLSVDWYRKKLHCAKKSKTPTDLTHQNPHTESPKVHRADLKLQIPATASPPSVTDTVSISMPPRPGVVVRHPGVPSSVVTETGTGLPTPNTVSTPLSRRHPAEDTTLDYAYDNAGMNFTPSPVGEVDKAPRHESNF